MWRIAVAMACLGERADDARVLRCAGLAYAVVSLGQHNCIRLAPLRTPRPIPRRRTLFGLLPNFILQQLTIGDVTPESYTASPEMRLSGMGRASRGHRARATRRSVACVATPGYEDATGS